MNNSLIYIFFFSFLLSVDCNSQQLNLKLNAKDSLENVFLKEITFNKKNLDTKTIYTELKTIQFKLKKKGFLNNQIITLTKTDSLYTAFFDLGKQYKKIHLNISDDLQVYLKQTKYKYIGNSVVINFDKISIFLNKLVAYFEKNGYAFTNVNLKNIALKNDIVVADIIIDKDTTRTIDKIIIKGYPKFPKKYLSNHIGIKLNSTFKTEKLTQISKNSKTIPFVEEIKKPQILFTKDSTLIYIYLKKKHINRFDGLIGFSSNKENGNLNFEGYLDIQLNNIFNSGEHLQLVWKSNTNQNKKLMLEAEIPYLLRTKFTPKASLEIYSQDSTFINLTSNLEINYRLNNQNKIGGIMEIKNATDLSDTTSANSVSDFSTFFYGINYDYKILSNHILFPVKYYLSINSLFGTRKTNLNSKKQQKLGFTSYYFYQINSKNSIFLKNISNILLSDNYIDNELFRIGGSKSIRGFQEDSILSSMHSIFNLEYRLTTNKTSYLYTVTDYAYSYNKVSQVKSVLYALGLGYAFTTKAGLLNLSYVLGKTNTQTFDLNKATIHLKLATFF